jgi:hypothetical protein
MLSKSTQEQERSLRNTQRHKILTIYLRNFVNSTRIDNLARATRARAEKTHQEQTSDSFATNEKISENEKCGEKKSSLCETCERLLGVLRGFMEVENELKKF